MQISTRNVEKDLQGMKISLENGSKLEPKWETTSIPFGRNDQ